MNFSKPDFFRCLLVPLAVVLLLGVARIGSAATPLVIDGRDVANLASEGNHGTFHNPPVNFAFVFGGVAADNPDAGPGDPPGPTETHFNYTGTDSGGLGFGTASSGQGLAFGPASMFQFEIDITVNAANTLPSLRLNLKDRDATPPLGTNIEELQYDIPLPAPGPDMITLTAMLAMPDNINTPRDGIPNFDPGGLGLEELQLQYGFQFQGSGHILDVTIWEMRIDMKVPEPSSIALCSLGAVAMCGFGVRRRQR